METKDENETNLNLPEIWETGIVNQLNSRDISALMTTCHFFNDDKRIRIMRDIMATKVVAGRSHTMILTSNNRLLVCGDNSCGQLGLGHTNSQLTFIPNTHYSEIIEEEKPEEPSRCTIL